MILRVTAATNGSGGLGF